MNDITKITKEDKIAFILRGHIRTSFDDNKLYNLLKKTTNEYDVDIYIYTFNIKSAGKIYKTGDMEIDGQNITQKDVKDYFKDLIKFIKVIIIDNDSFADSNNDRYIGNISKNKFLHMWSSIYNITDFVKNTKINYKYVINMRLDYHQLSDKFPKTFSLNHMRRLFYIDVFEDFIKNLDISQNFLLANIVNNEDGNLNKFFKGVREKNKKKLNVLLNIKYDKNDILYGIDNLFAGNINFLHKLSHTFVFHMDEIFDFLSEIISDLSAYAKFYGGCGGPHEAILPLFIKNKFDLYS